MTTYKAMVRQRPNYSYLMSYTNGFIYIGCIVEYIFI